MARDLDYGQYHSKNLTSRNMPYQICTRCVMDSSVHDISFDEQGVCNYCTEYLIRYSNKAESAEGKLRFCEKFHKEVRRNGRGKRYDCVVGLSGGVDSSYALYLAVSNGLRPLAVHLDNGWDSELAQNNIANLVRALNVDLYTHVIDWTENRDMQRALFKAGVIDIEMIMDNAQAATNYAQAARLGLKDILSGTNTRTEGMPMPAEWVQYKFDVKNIRAIQRKFGTMPIRTHPLIGTWRWLYYERVRGIRWHMYLDFFEYNKANAVEILQRQFGYVAYRYKHSESVFTRFYQNYILPGKFGADKRRVHHSTQICTGQMTRDEAIKDLATNPYVDSGEAASDKKYVSKKLGFTEEEFDAYMKRPPVSHSVFPSEVNVLRTMRRVKRIIGK